MATHHLAPLAELATEITDGDHLPPPKAESGVPFITISNIHKGTNQIDFSDTFKVPRKYFDNLKENKKPIVGDVLYTVTGSFGIPVVVKEQAEFCFQRHIALIRPKSCVNSQWLFYTLMSPQVIMQANEGATGTAQKTVSLKVLREITVPRVPSVEQKRIVAILDEAFEGIDTAVANTDKNLANARQLFDNFLDSVFVQQGEGWVQKNLGDIATFKNGLNFTKGSKGEIIKIVGVKDFQKNLYVPTSQLETAQIDGRLSADYELRVGDILTVRSNGNKQLIGRCILASEVLERTSHSGFTIRIRAASKEVSPTYLVHFLKSKRSRDMLIASGDGTNISSLNQQALSSLPVTLPPIADQLAITERIEAVAAETQNLEVIYQRKLDSLAELKQAFLHKAFAGELTAHSEEALPEAAE